MTTLSDYLSHVEDRLARVLSSLTALRDRDGMTVLDRIADLRHPSIAAQRYDKGPKATELWCEYHSRDLRACHSRGEQCDGIPITRPTDPTGEAGIVSNEADRAWQIVKDQSRVLDSVCDDLEAVCRQFALVDPAKASQLAMELTEANQNEPCCADCAKVDSWGPPSTTEPTTVAGRLDVAILLCDWHEKWVRKTGHRATRPVSRAHAKGQRLRFEQVPDGTKVVTVEGLRFVDWVPGSRKAAS